MSRHGQDKAIEELQESLGTLRWSPGDVIVANLGVACPTSADQLREELRNVLGSELKIAVFFTSYNDIRLSVIATNMPDAT